MTKTNQEIQSNQYKLKTSQKVYLVFKAGFDFIFSLIMLLLLIPLFIVVAIAIKIDSKGPVFFYQKRIGKNGKEFTIVKFRSMTIDANHEVATSKYEQVAGKITKVGRFIRKLSIDELPQLFCVLTFKMSLIGYRPLILSETSIHKERLKYNMYQIRPGLTGWAQINGRDAMSNKPKKKAEYDFYYLQHISFGLDFKIFFKTIGKVIKSDGVKDATYKKKQKSAEKEQAKEKVAVTEYMAEKEKETKEVG